VRAAAFPAGRPPSETGGWPDARPLPDRTPPRFPPPNPTHPPPRYPAWPAPALILSGVGLPLPPS
jgi:hypothetical protein